MLIKAKNSSLAITLCICSFMSVTSFAETLQNSHAIAGGSYLNKGGDTRPLLARTHNGGSSWFYPSSILDHLPSDAGPTAFFTGALCIKARCVASGSYTQILSPNNNRNFPLLAFSDEDGDQWIYPDSLYSGLPTNFESGQFVAAPRCSGLNCVAGGDFIANSIQYPLVANSNDGGNTWSYPLTAISTLPNNFNDKGQIYGSSSIQTSFISVGRYLNNNNTFYPLLLQSQDGGQNWNYPSSITANLPADYFDGAIFNSVNCSLTTCVAAGKYVSNKPGFPFYPLIATSLDKGLTWSYPPSVITNLPNNYFNLVNISQVSCSAQYCVVAGEFLGISGIHYPLIMTSTDNGLTWSTPRSIINDLPSDFQNTARFLGVHCNRKICLAVGQYESSTRNNQVVPLMAHSLDGGVTWRYRSTAISNLPSNLFSGELNSAYCNSSDCNVEGSYRTFNNMFYPLIANSHDSGQTWTYPTTPVDNLPQDFLNNGLLSNGNSSFNIKPKELKK